MRAIYLRRNAGTSNFWSWPLLVAMCLYRHHHRQLHCRLGWVSVGFHRERTVDCVGQRCKEMDPHTEWKSDLSIKFCRSAYYVYVVLVFFCPVSLDKTSPQKSKEQNHEREVFEPTFVLLNMLNMECQNHFHRIWFEELRAEASEFVPPKGGKWGNSRWWAWFGWCQSMEVFVFIFEMLQNLVLLKHQSTKC